MKKVSWFQITICVGIIGGLLSLLTPYPASFIRALRGIPETKTITISVPTPSPGTEPKPQPISPPPPPPIPQQDLRSFVPLDPIRTLSLPEVQYPPFPPVLPHRPSIGAMLNITELARGLNLKTVVNFEQGTTASHDRKLKSNYQMTLTLNIKQPQALTEKKDLIKINPYLEKIFPHLDSLLKAAKVSPYYGLLYTRKQTEIRKKLTSVQKILDRHNYYDTETILEITHPQSQRKLLWLQSEMDVVSDGSDGDRLATMPEKILNSSFYQPSTSYRWEKKTNTPNPLLKPWENRLASYKESLKKAKKEEKNSLHSKIDHAQRVITELKRYSFLISEYDPFIVVPLGIVNQRGNFSPQFGDYAVVIVGDKLYPAIVGDAGPRYKAGEASIRLAKTINPRSSIYSRPVSDLTVSYLIFPGSAEPTPGPPNYTQLSSRCQELLKEIGGIAPNYKLHQWTDLLAPKPPPAPTQLKTPATSPSSKQTEKPATSEHTPASEPPLPSVPVRPVSA